jgi:hypothetical protein
MLLQCCFIHAVAGVFQDQSLYSLAFMPELPYFAVGLSDLSIQILDQQTKNVVREAS